MTTWAPAASRARRTPTAVAVAPPIPASTSSKTIAARSSASAKTTTSASRTRESSPPDADLPSGRAGSPGLGASKNSQRSAPFAVGVSSGSNATEKRAAGIASACSSATIAVSSLPAACRRSARNRSTAPSSALRASRFVASDRLCEALARLADAFERPAVFFLQSVELLEPGDERLELSRIVLREFALAGELEGGVAGLALQPSHHLVQRAQPFGIARDPAERRRCVPERVDRSAFAGERFVRRGERRGDPLDIRQIVAPLAETFVLSRLGRCSIDLIDRKDGELVIRLRLAGGRAQTGRLGGDFRVPRIRLRDAQASLSELGAAEPIQQLELICRRQETLRFVLAHHLDDALGEGAQLPGTDRNAVDPGGRAAVGRHLANDRDGLADLGLDPAAREFVPQLGVGLDLEHHSRALRPSSDHLALAARTEREIECAQEHRLAGSGLAGKNRQTVGERHLDPFDEPESFD